MKHWNETLWVCWLWYYLGSRMVYQWVWCTWVLLVGYHRPSWMVNFWSSLKFYSWCAHFWVDDEIHLCFVVCRNYFCLYKYWFFSTSVLGCVNKQTIEWEKAFLAVLMSRRWTGKSLINYFYSWGKNQAAKFWVEISRNWLFLMGNFSKPRGLCKPWFKSLLVE